MSLFSSVLYHCRFLFILNIIKMESTLYVLLPDDIFLPCDHGLDFDISLRARVCEKSIKNQIQMVYVCMYVWSHI